MSEGMQFEKFDPGDNIQQDESVVIEPDTEPTGHRGTLEAALGLDGAETSFEAPEDPDVKGFMDVVEGRPVEKPTESKRDPQVDELIEANQRLASQLGKQGNEVIGPLRQEVDTLRNQLAQFQQTQGRPHSSQSEVIADTIQNLYGSDADVDDPAYRRHAMAHINAGNRLGSAIEEQYIKPLTQRIESLQQKLEEAESRSSLPAEQQEALLQQYPSLRDLPSKQRASMMQDLVRNRPMPGPRPMDPQHYVEPTMPTAPVKPSEKAQVAAFDSLDTDQQGAALGQMLARRGLRSLGR